MQHPLDVILHVYWASSWGNCNNSLSYSHSIHLHIWTLTGTCSYMHNVLWKYMYTHTLPYGRYLQGTYCWTDFDVVFTGMMLLVALKYLVTCPECEFPGDAARLVYSDTQSVSENSSNVSGSMSGWRDRSLIGSPDFIWMECLNLANTILYYII